MDAMIFAAGLGTRLRPLTRDIPKALVDIGGVPILEHVARRLVDAGADRLIINTHPHPDQIRAFVRDRDGFGVEVRFSHEPDAPLDTAGGLRQARDLFRADAPFFLHNCDVYSDIDLRALYEAHTAARDGRIASLAVLPPSAERYLIFDDAGLCGFSPRGGGEPVHVRPAVGARVHRDFSGIHVCDPALLGTLDDDTAPSIIMHYMKLSGDGARIARHDALTAHWIDIGTHEKLDVARRLYREGTARHRA
ncbi:MAG TPA: sugar phosphate nucleotidyltransferase [Longimicrobiales bacterium]|nr:sugar phosphate nucleotidyltransferase [Longimicrobiales bacterium]